MRSTSRSNWLSVAGLLLAFPTAYIICISVLKYGLNIPGPFDASAPLFEKWGIKEPLGWNITLLILLGPVAGFILAALQVLEIRFRTTNEQFKLEVNVARKVFPIAIGVFSLLVLATLFFYMVGENCNQPCV